MITQWRQSRLMTGFAAILSSKPLAARAAMTAAARIGPPGGSVCVGARGVWVCGAWFGAGGGSRTRMGKSPGDFKSPVSTVPPRPRFAPGDSAPEARLSPPRR